MLIFPNYHTKPFSCIRNQIKPNLTNGRASFNKPKLLKEFLKSWPHSEMQWASSTAMRVIPGGHRTSAQQAAAFLRSHQQCFSFCSWNAFCCTNSKSSFIKKCPRAFRVSPSPQSKLCVMSGNKWCHYSHQWVKNLQLSKRLKYNYQFKLPGNSPTVLSPTYQQFCQGPEVNLSSLNKTLESCIWLYIHPWKTRKKIHWHRRPQAIKFNKIMIALKNNMRTTGFWWETRGVKWRP